MAKFEIVHFNSLECEVGRYPVEADELGFPLVLASFQDPEIRYALGVLEPGDTLRFVENEEAAATDFDALAAHAYAYAEEHYGDKDARFDVIVECMGKSEIAAQFREQGINDYAAAIKWAKRAAGAAHEQELNQAWDGPESCVGSSKYVPEACDPMDDFNYVGSRHHY